MYIQTKQLLKAIRLFQMKTNKIMVEFHFNSRNSKWSQSRFTQLGRCKQWHWTSYHWRESADCKRWTYCEEISARESSWKGWFREMLLSDEFGDKEDHGGEDYPQEYACEKQSKTKTNFRNQNP